MFSLSEKFMNFVKKTVSVVLVLGLLSTATACSTKSNAMIEMMENQTAIEIVVTDLELYDTAQGTISQKSDWVVLDQKKTHNEKGFRSGFDSIFNINNVTEQGLHGKDGVLFINALGERDSNTTIENALRNEVFWSKYMESGQVLDEISNLILTTSVYDDVSKEYGTGDMTAFYAAFNAYYEILPNYENPDYFNAKAPVTRADFLAFMFKAGTGVMDIHENEEFHSLMELKEPRAEDDMASIVEQFGWLTVENGGLQPTLYSSNITKAEAAYYIANRYFEVEFARTELDAKAFDGIKGYDNYGERIGLLEKEEGPNTTDKPWKAYALKNMVENPKNGLDGDLHRALQTLLNLDVIDETFVQNWSQGVSNEELFQLYFNAMSSLNGVDGYVTDNEYNQGSYKLENFYFEAGSDELGKIGLDYVEGGEDTESGTNDGKKIIEKGTLTKEEALSYEEQVITKTIMEIVEDSTRSKADKIEEINLFKDLIDIQPFIDLVNTQEDTASQQPGGSGGTAGEQGGTQTPETPKEEQPEAPKQPEQGSGSTGNQGSGSGGVTGGDKVVDGGGMQTGDSGGTSNTPPPGVIPSEGIKPSTVNPGNSFDD